MIDFLILLAYALKVKKKAPREIDCHPFFVFGKPRVGLLEIAEFLRFVRRTRCVGEEHPEFGRFGSILLRSEHLTRPFCGKREVDQTICRLLKLLKPNSFTARTHNLSGSRSRAGATSTIRFAMISRTRSGCPMS